MFRFKRMQPVLVSVLTVAVFVVGTLTTEAARKDPGLPGNHLTIEAVAVTLNAAGFPHTAHDYGRLFQFWEYVGGDVGRRNGPLRIHGSSHRHGNSRDYPGT
jgi:hypothetical protein